MTSSHEIHCLLKNWQSWTGKPNKDKHVQARPRAAPLRVGRLGRRWSAFLKRHRRPEGTPFALSVNTTANSGAGEGLCKYSLLNQDQ